MLRLVAELDCRRVSKKVYLKHYIWMASILDPKERHDSVSF